MYFSTLLLLSVVVLFLRTSSQIPHVISVGLFSLCENSTNLTLFNQKALYYKNLYTKLPRHTKEKVIELNNKTDFSFGVDFIYFDVCNDPHLLVEHLLTILLRREFFHQGSNMKEQRVFLLHAFIPPFMSKLIEEITSGVDFVKLCAPVNCDKRFLLQQSEDYSQYLFDLLHKLKWYDVTLVLITQNNFQFPWLHYFEESYNLLKRTKQFCLKKKMFKVPHKNFTRHMFYKVFPVLQDIVSNKSALIFFHPSIMHAYIKWQMNRIPITTKLLFHDFTLYTATHQINWIAIINIQRSRLDTYLRHIAFEFSMDDTHGEQSILQFALSLGMYTRLLLGRSALNVVTEHAYSLLGGEGTQNSFLQPVSYSTYQQQDPKLWLYHPEIASNRFFNSINFAHLPCPISQCWPGYQQEYKLINNSVLYDEQVGFQCVKCPINYIITNSGNICRPCKDLRYIDNGNRTLCIDPFKDNFPAFEASNFCIVVILSTLAAVSCFIFLIIFIINRNTPVVKVSDYHVSLLHLSTLFTTTILTVFSYTFPPNVWGISFLTICVSRNLLLTVFYASNVAFIFIKSQKLLNAFLSALRLTSSEMKRTIAVQMFTVLLFPLISNLLLLIMYMRDGVPQVIQKLDHINLIRMNLCSTTQQRNILMWNMNIYQMVCLIQAFRGRNLPGPMNNAMALVYATMTTTISFAVCTILSFFQHGMFMDFIECTVIILNCATSAYLLYAKQCFTIIFKPQKNTRQYFSHKRMQEMRLQAGINN